MNRQQWRAIRTAKYGAIAVAFFTLGGFAGWYSHQEPELSKRELETIRVASQFDSACGLIERK